MQQRHVGLNPSLKSYVGVKWTSSLEFDMEFILICLLHNLVSTRIGVKDVVTSPRKSPNGAHKLSLSHFKSLS